MLSGSDFKLEPSFSRFSLGTWGYTLRIWKIRPNLFYQRISPGCSSLPIDFCFSWPVSPCMPFSLRFSSPWGYTGLVPTLPRITSTWPEILSSLIHARPIFKILPLLPLSAYWLGLANSQAAFELYTAIAFLLAFFAIFYFASRNLREAALFGALTLALSPASLTCLLWLGLPDQFIVLFSAILAFAAWPPALFVVTFLGVANHPLFLFVSLSLAGLRFFAGQKEFNWRQILSIVLGAFSGYISVQAFLSYYQIQIGVTRLGLMFEHDIIDWFLVKAIEAPLSIFSLYNGLWFVLAACVLYGFPRRKSYYSVFLILQFGAAVITFFTYDTTRIFSLLTIGAVIHCVVFTYQLAVQNRHDIIFRRLMIVLFLAAIIFAPLPCLGWRLALSKNI